MSTRLLRSTPRAFASPFAAGPSAAPEPLGLARAARYADLVALGSAALPPLLDTYPTPDRETRTAILLALGSMNIKSPAAKAVLRRANTSRGLTG